MVKCPECNGHGKTVIKALQHFDNVLAIDFNDNFWTKTCDVCKGRGEVNKQ